MKLKHQASLTSPTEGATIRVTSLVWSPNGKRLAVCTSDRVVWMFDENGVRKDKFATKPNQGGPKNYIVRAMAFSPGSDKLAIAQSDNMLFVYKLGAEWGDKKTICNKFPEKSSITCVSWPSKRDPTYGTAEGKVVLGKLVGNKAMTLYNTQSYVTVISSNTDGSSIVAGHLDGTIRLFTYEGRNEQVIVRHPCVPFSIAWGQSIVVAGNDQQITFYDEYGGEENTFDYR